MWLADSASSSLVIWAAATLNFLLPRLSGQDPVREKLMQQAAASGYVHTGINEMVEEYQREFGLDQPLWRQYLTYLGSVARLDFGYSIANYPAHRRQYPELTRSPGRSVSS